MSLGLSTCIVKKVPKWDNLFLGLQTFIVRLLMNFTCATSSFYTRIERRGKGLTRGETERECVCETESRWKCSWCPFWKRPLEEGLTILRVLRTNTLRFSWETILMGKGDQQRYIKITKIEIIFADAWWHLVMTTFHLHFPYMSPLCLLAFFSSKNWYKWSLLSHLWKWITTNTDL